MLAQSELSIWNKNQGGIFQHRKRFLGLRNTNIDAMSLKQTFLSHENLKTKLTTMKKKTPKGINIAQRWDVAQNVDFIWIWIWNTLFSTLLLEPNEKREDNHNMLVTQSSRDCEPNPHSAPGGIRTGVSQMEGEAWHHFAKPDHHVAVLIFSSLGKTGPLFHLHIVVMGLNPNILCLIQDSNLKPFYMK